jgi:hypothetical protein
MLRKIMILQSSMLKQISMIAIVGLLTKQPC